MKTDRFDAIVIGTGQSGPTLASRLAGAGRKVAVVERHLFGGTCVNTGCIPTKTLVASARAAHVARRGADYGVMIDGPIRVDMKKVKERKDGVVRKSNEGLENWLKNTDNLTVYEGHGRFESPKSVRVGDHLLEAGQIFLNVGARALAPRIAGLEDVPYHTNSTMMEVDFLPPHLVILGGSYVGLEFGQMYRRFGSEVTVLQRGSHLLSREDEDISTTVREILEKEGIRILTGADVSGVSNGSGRLRVQANIGGRPEEITGSHLLVATGRTPNTHDLGLDKAGIRTDDRGFIQVDDQLRTSVEGIWALGDCNGKGAFTHTSYNDYEIVAANLLDGESRRVSDRIQAYAIYIDPPLGRAGMSEQEVRDAGRKALIGTRPMSKVGRAVEKGETEGFIKILVDDQSSQILGAAILGVEGDEVIHTILDVMYAKAPYTVLQRAMHIHPTVSELIPTVLGSLKPLEKTTKTASS